MSRRTRRTLFIVAAVLLCWPWPSFCAPRPRLRPRACCPSPTASSTSTSRPSALSHTSRTSRRRIASPTTRSSSTPPASTGSATSTRWPSPCTACPTPTVPTARWPTPWSSSAKSPANASTPGSTPMPPRAKLYTGHTIYSIPRRTAPSAWRRSATTSIAVSNTPTTEQIHSILDRHRTAALPFPDRRCLQHHYHDVPLLSLAWGVGQIGLPFSESGAIHVFGVAASRADSTIIASVAPACRLAQLVASARRRNRRRRRLPPPARPPTWPRWSPWLADLTSPSATSKANNSSKQLLKTAEVTQHGERVVVTASLPASFFDGIAVNFDNDIACARDAELISVASHRSFEAY